MVVIKRLVVIREELRGRGVELGYIRRFLIVRGRFWFGGVRLVLFGLIFFSVVVGRS